MIKTKISRASYEDLVRDGIECVDRLAPDGEEESFYLEEYSRPEWNRVICFLKPMFG
jgi:hypothetical protein